MKLKIIFWSFLSLFIFVLVAFGILDISVPKEFATPVIFIIAFILLPVLLTSFAQLVIKDYKNTKLTSLKFFYYLMIVFYISLLSYGKYYNAWIGYILLWVTILAIISLLLITILYFTNKEKLSIKFEWMIFLIPIIFTLFMLK